MNIFDQRFHWHRKFIVSNISKSHVKFISESFSSLVDIETYQTVNQFINSELPLIEYSLDIGPQQVALLHHRVQSLFDSGYLVAEREQSESYYTPDFKASYQFGDDNSCSVVMLSQCSELLKVEEVIENTNITEKIDVVIVDNYLDPRLAEIDDHFKLNNKPWLLLKLSGERALVGPLFSTQLGKPCWHCLHYRMKANDVLKWVNYDHKESNPLAVPALSCMNNIEQYMYDALPLINQLLVQGNNETLFELSQHNDSPRSHPVIHRPQCSSCGDHQYYDKQVNKEISISSSLKTEQKDGGVRCITPQQTVVKLTKLISPLSGLLTHLSMLSEGTEKTNKIFRSGFYQSPMTLDFLTYQLSNSTFMHTTMGKGISIEQSKASALSEAIERLASQYQGDEPFHLSTLKNDNYICPHQLSPYSEKQYQQFSEQKLNAEYQLYSTDKYTHDIEIQWTPVWSLTENKKQFLPLSYCYAHTPFDAQKYSRFFHNGGAAGNTLEEALLQAFLEIVERDAVSIWWYNQLLKPSLNIQSVSPSLIEQLQHTLGEEWQYWTLDLTHDLNIPVIAAIAQNNIDHSFSFGFGCHIDPIIACQRALTELCQITEIRHNNVAPFDFNQIEKKQYLFPDERESKLSDFCTPQNKDIADDLSFCFEQATNAGLNVLALNYTRPDMVLHTAKVVLPGACHIFPYFAAERLYQVPVKMGWLDKPKRESELNQQALLI